MPQPYPDAAPCNIDIQWLRNMDCSLDGGICTGRVRDLGFALFDMLSVFVDADDFLGVEWLIQNRSDFSALLTQHSRIFTVESWVYFSEMGHGDMRNAQRMHEFCVGGLESLAPTGLASWMASTAARLLANRQRQILMKIPCRRRSAGGLQSL